jgi:mRNA-degrading endonuclease RelE of RelBE toxin-antitoxin system
VKYDYALSREAERYFRKLEPRRQEQVLELLEQLCANPRDPFISRPLSGEWQGARRSRLGIFD